MPSKAKRSSRLSAFSTLCVALPPTPTNTGTRPATVATVRSTSSSISASSSVGDSPVVPSGNSPSTPQRDVVLDQPFVAREVDGAVLERRDEGQPEAGDSCAHAPDAIAKRHIIKTNVFDIIVHCYISAYAQRPRHRPAARLSRGRRMPAASRRAAAALGVSQAAASQQIKRLEEALDCRLFERAGRGWCWRRPASGCSPRRAACSR